MNGVELIPPRTGEVIGDAPDRRVELVSDHESLDATWSRFGPHREGADLHVHRHHTDVFYVLDGEFTLRLGLADEQVRVGEGTLIRVPPLVVHGFRNASGAELRYLNFHAPGMRFADYLRALRDGRRFAYDQHDPYPPADGGRPAGEVAIGERELVEEGGGLRRERLADVAEIVVDEVRVDGRELAWPAGPALRSLYVLEGELEIAAAPTTATASVGSWVRLAPGESATVSASAARFLELRTPNVV